MIPQRPLNELRRYVGQNRDWRQGVWNRWLVSYLTPKDEDETTPSEQTTGAASTGETPARDDSTDQAETARVQEAATGDATEDDAPPSTRELPSERRPLGSARARLDAITEQLYALESAVDTLSQRSHIARLEERRQNQRLVDLLERLVDTEEKNAEALVACSRALERLERRVARLEPGARPSSFGTLAPRTGLPEAILERVGLERTVLDPVDRNVETRLASEGPGFERSQLIDADCATSLHGNLSDLSLPTLLSMFELEQRTGRLTVEGAHGPLGFELSGGLVVGVRQSGSERDPVEALREALDWRDVPFTFAQTRVVPSETPALTVGALLLRASQKNDEARSAVG